VVCETRENRLISKSESKDDFQDAHRLARLLRVGEFKEVHLPRKARQEVRELVRAYRKAVGDVVRGKNRIRCKYRERGVRITSSAYDRHRRGAWLKKIRSKNIQFLLEQHYRILDASIEAQRQLAGKLSAQLSRTREYKLLAGIPGLGPITVPILLSIIDDPARFETKRKLWSYAGLGKKRRSSGRQRAKEGGSKQGCRLLKYAAMTAAEGAMKGDNRFSRRFREMVRDGTSPGNARRTIARSILATALAIWKSGIPYQPDEPE
jgi:transposase